MRRITLFALIATLAVAFTSTTRADTFSWNNPLGGDWNNPANWTPDGGNTSARLFPDDGSDIAIFDLALPGDATINIPDVNPGSAVDFQFEDIRAGDQNAAFNFIFDGPGKLATPNPNGGRNEFNALNGATNLIDIQVNTGNFPGFSGSGKWIVNGTVSSNRQMDSSTTVQVNGQILVAAGFFNVVGNRWKIGNDNWTNFSTLTGKGNNGTLVAVGGDRVISQNLNYSNGRNHDFDGSNGNNLTVTGNATLIGRNFGNAFIVNTSRLTLSGNVSLGNSSHPINLANQPLKVINGGTLELSGNGNSAATDVGIEGNGTLLLNNTAGSATGTGNLLEIDSDVTLGGDGSTDSSVRIASGGTVSPGNSIGTLNLGSTTFETGSTMIAEIARPASDLLEITGDLDLTGDEALILEISRAKGLHTIVTYTGTRTGVFDTIIANVNSPFVDFGQVIYDDANNQILVEVIPEPATLSLLALGAASLFRRRRRS